MQLICYKSKEVNTKQIQISMNDTVISRKFKNYRKMQMSMYEKVSINAWKKCSNVNENDRTIVNIVRVIIDNCLYCK